MLKALTELFPTSNTIRVCRYGINCAVDGYNVIELNSMQIKLKPLAITLNKKDLSNQFLEIEWNDGKVCQYPLSHLREACPCATCREKRAEPKKPNNPLALNVLSATEARPLTIDGMKPVGNYAYSIEFSDGHDTGIFTFDLLQKLGQPVED